MPRSSDRWLDSRTFFDCRWLAGRRKKKRLAASVVLKPRTPPAAAKPAESVPAAKAPEAEPLVESAEPPVAAQEEVIEEPPPSAEEMAAYLGEPGDPVGDEGAADSSDRPIPSLEEVGKRISPKTKALMDELFRAKLNKVQRINPKKIR